MENRPIRAVTEGKVDLVLRGTDHASKEGSDDKGSGSQKKRGPPPSNGPVMDIVAGEQTNDLGAPSVELKLMASQDPTE